MTHALRAVVLVYLVPLWLWFALAARAWRIEPWERARGVAVFMWLVGVAGAFASLYLTGLLAR